MSEERGRKGNLSGAFARNRSRGATRGVTVGNSPVPRRGRRSDSGTGKRSRPEEYGQMNGMVRREVLERFEYFKSDPEVRRALAEELGRVGIEFKRGDPDNGAIIELLLTNLMEEYRG